MRYWYSPEYFSKFERLQTYLEVLAPGLVSIGTELLKTLSDHLYSNCFLNIKSYSEPLREEEDPYETTPLLFIYSFIASINRVVFDRWQYRATPDEKKKYAYYYSAQDSIDFCVDNQLIVTVGTCVCDYNISELLRAFDQLETKLHTLSFCAELVLYLEALELRAGDFLLRKQDAESLNVENLRVMHPTEGWFVCTTACEYMIITRALCLRAALEGVLESFRDHEQCIREPYAEEMARVEIIFKTMLAEIQNVHSDKLQDDFIAMYERASIRTSVGYQWMKENFGTSFPEPGAAINQFEGAAAWNAICSQSKTAIDRHFYEMKDPLAFWLIFFAVVEMMLKATVKVNWATSNADHEEGCRVSDYFITNYTLRTLEYGTLDTILLKSHTVPLFLQSFNDASIMLQGQLFIFGNRPIDYLRALHAWVDIIDTVFHGVFDSMADIHPFRKKLFNEEIHPDLARYTAVAVNSEFIDLFNKTKAQIDEEHRQARIGFVLNAQQTSELQVTNILEKDSGANLKPTNKSAWF